MKRCVAGLVFALALLPAVAAARSGPSFSCARAIASDERAVCASPALVSLDRRMARAWQRIAGCTAMGTRGDMIDWQRRWLAQRHACGVDRACLAGLYRPHVALLERYARRTAHAYATQSCPDNSGVPPLG